MSENNIQFKDPITLRMGKNPDGTVYRFVSKQDVIDRLNDIQGVCKWQHDFAEITPEAMKDKCAIVRGRIVLSKDQATPFVTGAHPVNDKVSYGEALMKAENINLKRAASYLGIPVTDEAEPAERKEGDPEPKVVEPQMRAIDGGAARPEVPVEKVVFHEGPVPAAEETTPEVAPSEPRKIPANFKGKVKPEGFINGELDKLTEKAPKYETIYPHREEIMNIDFRAYKDTMTIKKKLADYGVDLDWVGNGMVRVSRDRYLECIEFMREIIKAGPNRQAPAPVEEPEKPALEPVVVKDEKPAVIEREEIIGASAPVSETVPIPVGSFRTIDIGPAPREDYALLGDMLDKIEIKASEVGVSPDAFIQSKGVTSEISDWISSCSQEEFDALFD